MEDIRTINKLSIEEDKFSFISYNMIIESNIECFLKLR